MLLSQAGIKTTPDTLIDSVYVPEKKGSFATELKATARRLGRLPYEIDPSLTALTQALADGYPVLLLQNLGLGFYPKWHFAVTIGIDRANNNFILRSGPDRRLELSLFQFERRWRLGEYWAIVLLKPGDLPEWVRQDQYENQFSMMEATWNSHLEDIYQRIHKKWPGSTMATLGQGNIAYSANALDVAADYYQQTLSLDQDHIAALHNLAQVKFDLGDYDRSRDLICRAKSLAQGHPLESYIKDLEGLLMQVNPDLYCPTPDKY